MKKHTAKISPLTACNSPVLSLTWVEGNDEIPEALAQFREDSVAPCCWPSPLGTLGRVAVGLALAVCLAGSWAGMTQLAKAALRDFESPFLVAWHSANWNLLLFPGYCSCRLLTSGERGLQLRQFSQCSHFLSQDPFSLRRLLKQTAPFSILWTLTNYLYFMGLKKISTTDASALFCCNKAFVFLLSWIVLKDRFMGVR
ncbi:putative thiamine transporter SLC35F3, partial [Chiloscyllium plagiosum]|uniref:putative thiamine transporter SLC35F3 n=1 Tax=Chiloscyllium plagiosum TaxID=36176 RepID=UPI001CB88294